MTEPAVKSKPYLFFVGLCGLLCVFLYSKSPTVIPSSFLGRLLKPSGNAASFNSTRDEFIAQYQDGCPAHHFKSIRRVSRSPNIMLIEGFLTEAETDVLLGVAYSPPFCH